MNNETKEEFYERMKKIGFDDLPPPDSDPPVYRIDIIIELLKQEQSDTWVENSRLYALLPDLIEILEYFRDDNRALSGKLAMYASAYLATSPSVRVPLKEEKS